MKPPRTLRTRVRVTKHPDGYWFWICRIPGEDGKVDLWCLSQSLAFSASTLTEALLAAEEHHRCHIPGGGLTLTFDGFMAATSS